MGRAEKVIKAGFAAGNLLIRTSVDVDPGWYHRGEGAFGPEGKYAGLVNIQVAAFAQEGFENILPA